MNLIYINELGPNYKGENIYEFIFTENSNDEIWGNDWDAKPANGYPSPPDIEYVKKVGVLKNNEITLAVIQNSDYFCMADAIDGVIALGWENDENEVDFGSNKRLVFRYGDDEQMVKDKLYERDIVLEFEKKVVYEK
jgi:hypothetical protein